MLVLELLEYKPDKDAASRLACVDVTVNHAMTCLSYNKVSSPVEGTMIHGNGTNDRYGLRHHQGTYSNSHVVPWDLSGQDIAISDISDCFVTRIIVKH